MHPAVVGLSILSTMVIAAIGITLRRTRCMLHIARRHKPAFIGGVYIFAHVQRDVVTSSRLGCQRNNNGIDAAI